MVTDGNYVYGEHCIMHRIVKSLCCAPETNVTLYVNCILIIKIKKNQRNRKGNNQEANTINILSYSVQPFVSICGCGYMCILQYQSHILYKKQCRVEALASQKG